jgi:hypothetical protein
VGNQPKRSWWHTFTVTLRIVGAFFVLDGLVLFVWGLSLVLNPDSPIDINGVPTTSMVVKSIVLAGGLLVAILGLVLLFARPIQPAAGGSIGSILGSLFRTKNRKP